MFAKMCKILRRFMRNSDKKKPKPPTKAETIINIGELIINVDFDHRERKIRPILVFNYLFKNKNLEFMQPVSNLILTSTAPITLFMTVGDANNGNAAIAGTLSGLSYNPEDANQDIAVTDPGDPLSVDVHAVTNSGGTTVTGTGNFVSTLQKPDGSGPAFSGQISGTLVLVNNIPVAVLSPVLLFNQP